MLSALLSPEERARAASFRGPLLQRRYVAAHAALRSILGRKLGRPPASLRLLADVHGKPALADAADLHFNLSHSDGLALIAVGNAPLGVDVEAQRPMPDAADIAAITCSAGERALLSTAGAADYQQRFFQIWTRKEAYAKARGLGLALDFPGFCTAVPPVVSVAPEQDDGHVWHLIDLHPAPGYCGALVCPAGAIHLLTSDFAFAADSRAS